MAQLSGVAAPNRGQVIGDIGAKLDPFLAGPETHDRHDVIDQLTQVEVDQLDIDLAGFDLRVIEDVVQDPEQRLARRANHGQARALGLA